MPKPDFHFSPALAIAALLLFLSANGRCGECISTLTYKPWEPDCMTGESVEMLIVPVPVNCHYGINSSQATVREISRPFFVPTVDLEEKPTDRNPLSMYGITVRVEPDPNCRECVGSPWVYGDVPVIVVDLSSSTIEQIDKHGPSASEIIAGGFYSALLTFAGEADTTVSLQLKGLTASSLPEWSKFGSIFHWDGLKHELKEGPLNGWYLIRRRDGVWECSQSNSSK